MKQKITRRSSTQLVCGQAKPGANLAFLKKMALFCREFNEKTKDRNGELVSVEITVYEDGTYDYQVGNSPSSHLIKKMLGDKKTITPTEVEKIAAVIKPSLNTENPTQIFKIVTGTAHSMGIKLV